MKSHDEDTQSGTSGTTDKIEGRSKIISGKVKEETGKLVRSPALESKGNNEKTEGRVQEKVGEIKKVFDR